METADEDDDIRLVKTSAGILQDLEQNLPKLLRGRSGRIHSSVSQLDLDQIVNLIETFQGEPQLLDAKLQIVLPPIVAAYLEYLERKAHKQTSKGVDFQYALCMVTYTFCKVRGHKIIAGFLSNEPKHLETILEALERTVTRPGDQETQWQITYVLLLWLAHLLLTPFDLSSISTKAVELADQIHFADIRLKRLPSLVARILRVGLEYLPCSTKAQEVAASLLVRLIIRPDVQHLQLGDILVRGCSEILETADALMQPSLYSHIGCLRLLAGIGSSVELSHLVPRVYQTCWRIFDNQSTSLAASNAICTKIAIKIFRNVTTLSLRSAASNQVLTDFLEGTSLLENVIDYLLRSLGDKDTPVRQAAAKAISSIVLELDTSMGYEVVQAILDTFKEDIPRSSAIVEFATVNALRWHGLTLALAQILFKRSASPEQLPDILKALISALQFQQRTATGTHLGTNVRDAANFGIWSLSRRYTTSELLSVRSNVFRHYAADGISIVQLMAVQLILSACLDPSGNIRRGSSAALQELVGRHPDQVHQGIMLVQIVDYQAVGLRHRAMGDVAGRAASLHPMYMAALLHGISGWRGLGSSDVSSRRSAANSMATLVFSSTNPGNVETFGSVIDELRNCPVSDFEMLHGYTLTLALMLDQRQVRGPITETGMLQIWSVIHILQPAFGDYSPRMLRSEFPGAVAQYLTAMCALTTKSDIETKALAQVSMGVIESMTERLLVRHEDWILQLIPDLVSNALALKRRYGLPSGNISLRTLCQQVSIDSSKTTLHGAGRVVALGALASSFDSTELSCESMILALECISTLIKATNVDWRIIGVSAFQLVVTHLSSREKIEAEVAQILCDSTNRGLNDYTIDERGDVGSLVRLQAISCAATIFATPGFENEESGQQALMGSIYRLSLEKLDRVRFQAAKCCQAHLGLDVDVGNVALVSSNVYFKAVLSHLTSPNTPEWMLVNVLEGSISCCGTGAEPLMQAARKALIFHLENMSVQRLEQVMAAFVTIMKKFLADASNNDTQAALELLSFLLDMNVLERLSDSNKFKWRNLLSIVQKSHHKSNDVPKLIAALRVYVGLARFPSIEVEALKKLFSMLRTNPYPRVRVAAAEAVFIATQDVRLQDRDWSRTAVQHGDLIEQLRLQYVAE